MCMASLLIGAYIAIGIGRCLYEAHCMKQRLSDPLDGDDWFDAAILGTIWPLAMLVRK